MTVHKFKHSPEQLALIGGLEETSIIWTEDEIVKQELKKLPSKYIPELAKQRNYVMSCFDLWADYELYRFCQSSAVTSGDGHRSRHKHYEE